MFVTVAHEISDSDRFWSAAEQGLPNLPANLKLHQCTPSIDGKTAFCLWEVNSLESLQDWMERAVGEFSRNDYHIVQTDRAIGLPTNASSAQTATAGTNK